MIYLFAFSLGLNLALAWAVTALWSARQRTYRYAVDRSDLSERGCAYSDMASVIVLDGRIKPKNGTIVRDGKLDHRCRPPGAFEFGGDWKVRDTDKYPQDTVWRCDCGDYSASEAPPHPTLALRSGARLAALAVRRLDVRRAPMVAMRAHRDPVRPAEFFHEQVGVGLVAETVCKLDHGHTHTPIIRRGCDSETAGRTPFSTNSSQKGR